MCYANLPRSWGNTQECTLGSERPMKWQGGGRHQARRRGAVLGHTDGSNLIKPIANKIRYYLIKHGKPFASCLSDSPQPIFQRIKLVLSSKYIQYPTTLMTSTVTILFPYTMTSTASTLFYLQQLLHSYYPPHSSHQASS